MIQFFEEDSDTSVKSSRTESKGRKHNFRYPIIFRARRLSEFFTSSSNRTFVTAVAKQRLGLRVLRGFQFYTSRSLAKAIGQSTDIQEEHLCSKDLGIFPTLLQKICRKIRAEDECFMVVELTSSNPETMLHYLVMVRHRNSAGVTEDLLLGTEVTMEQKKVRDVHFVLSIPLLYNVNVHLYGENRFLISTPQHSYLLKPSTLQSQWAALTFLAGSIRHSQNSHAWCNYYSNHKPLDAYWRHKVRSHMLPDRTSQLNGSRKRRKSSPGTHLTDSNGEFCKLKLEVIQNEIRNVMHRVDPDVASCGSVRTEVEENLGRDLYEVREWMNEQILLIYGQMDEPTHILTYLLLGTEWNACNLDELLENGVTHILNTTHDIECFFGDHFTYLTVPVEDTPNSNLLQHWQDTYEFIKDCKSNNGKILVHCQRGISRSASTTIAYIMKEYRTSLQDALKLTVSKRSCVKPNCGFHKQLKLYEQLLASHKHSDDLSNVLTSNIINEP